MPAVNSFRKIGFTGLGIMGKPISKNLLKRVRKAVLGRGQRAVEEVVAAGANTAEIPRALREQVSSVITCCPILPEY